MTIVGLRPVANNDSLMADAGVSFEVLSCIEYESLADLFHSIGKSRWSVSFIQGFQEHCLFDQNI